MKNNAFKWWLITCALSGALIWGYETMFQPILEDINQNSSQIIIGLVTAIMFWAKAFICLLGVGIINGITGNGFRVRIPKPGEE